MIGIQIYQTPIRVQDEEKDIKYNFGRLVTKDFIRNIMNWCKQLKGDPIRINQTAQCPNCKKKIADMKEMAKADDLRQKGNQKMISKQYSQALDYYTLALQIQEKVKGKGCIQSVQTLQRMGVAWGRQQKYPQALNQFNLIYKIVKEKGRKQQLMITLCNIGNVYQRQKKYTLAFDYYTQALEVIEQAKGKKCLESAQILQSIGLTYFCLRMYAAAAESLQSSLIIVDKYSRGAQANYCVILLVLSLIILKKKAKVSYILAKYSDLINPNPF